MSQLSSQFLKRPRHFTSISLPDGSSVDVADPRATRALLCLMNMEATLRGAASHWGGPSAFAEIISSLTALVFNYSKNWSDHFHVINDAGHCENGLYAVKANYEYAGLTLYDLKKFRSISSFLTGHGEFHLFPKGVYLSNGPLGSTLAQAQGLCLADHLQQKKRTTVVLASDGGLMEGEAREALASIPGWFQKSKMAPFLLIVSDNNTKLSGRIDQDSFSMDPTLSSLKILQWRVITLKSPHDLTQTFTTIQEALKICQTAHQPVVLRAQTIKGYGIQKTMKTPSGGHGFPLKDANEVLPFLKEIYKDEKIPDEFLKWSKDLSQIASQTVKKNSSTPKEKVQEGISQALIKKMKEGFPLVSISADLSGSTGVLKFQKEFPNHTFDMGVAESNMISVAAGFSKQGFIPVVDTFAQFGVTKGALPLFMASLSGAPVMAFFSHLGFQDAADGASHQCLTYIAQTGSLPNTKIYTLSTKDEAQALVEQAIDRFRDDKKNIIFFLGREKFPTSYFDEHSKYFLDRAQVVFSNLSQAHGKKYVTLAATGTLVEQACKAAQKLEQKGWKVAVIHPSIINHPDILTFKSCLEKTKGHLLTIEDHRIQGGFSFFLSHSLIKNNISFQMHSLGVQAPFGRSAYQALDLYQAHGLDYQSIVEEAEKRFSS